MLEVDGERALVAVEREEADIDLVAARAASSGVTLPFAGDRLDLHDIGAEVSQTLRGEGTGHGDGTIENAVAAENAHGVRSPGEYWL